MKPEFFYKQNTIYLPSDNIHSPLPLLVRQDSEKLLDIFLDKNDLLSHLQILSTLTTATPNCLDLRDQLLLPFLEGIFNREQRLGMSDENFRPIIIITFNILTIFTMLITLTE
jgi:energy-converting hydrogenase A subunit M